MELTASEYIDLALSQNIFGSMLTHIHKLPPRPAHLRDTDKPLSPAVKHALAKKGVERLYYHQAVSIDNVREGKNVIVDTGTASGKSLCYSVPTLERLMQNPNSRALFLFPTKALGHDQIDSFNALSAAAQSDLQATAYDGDTAKEFRRGFRESGRVIVSNIDMLASSILPQHRVWSRFLSGLEFVVIDEVHYYRGVTGSHLAMLIRRLRRILAQYGANPIFILCSATLSNAEAHAEALTGLPFVPVLRDGAPASAKTFLMLNESESNAESKGINARAGAILAGLMISGLPSLTFVSNRAASERVVQYTKQVLQESAASQGLNGRNGQGYYDLWDRVKPYRAGYLPEYRRQTEMELKSGSILSLVSTNAMELGIDIGGLEGVVIVGYPGTVASFWQQAGRAGRQDSESVVLLLLKDNPVDQFYGINPAELYESPTESARISVSNSNILREHILCAAAESPLTRNDFEYFGEAALKNISAQLVEEGLIAAHSDRTRRLAPGVDNPSYRMNIRSIGGGELVELVDIESVQTLERVSWALALNELYPGAIYSHKGKPYRIRSFDVPRYKAFAERVDSYEYTTQVSDALVFPPENAVSVSVSIPNTTTFLIDTNVSVRVIGYKTQHLHRYVGNEFTEVENMPALEFPTKGLCLALDSSTDMPYTILLQPEGALHAFAHLAINALSMLAMCDPGDLSETLLLEHPQLPTPSVFIYENHEGGVGIVDYAAANPDKLLERIDLIVKGCKCRTGCPACVDMARCSDSTDIEPSKSGVISLLAALRQDQGVKVANVTR